METILIAEDSPTQRQMLQHMLEGEGYGVIATANGREALAQARVHRPDIVITDVIMPEMDGYQLCRELKANAELRHTAVILLTGLSDPKDIITGLQCGADNFIGKPFAEDYLMSRLRQVIANRALKQRENPDGSVDLLHEGECYRVAAGRAQMLDLLLSVYDAAIRRNQDLIAAQGHLTRLNAELERKFLDRERLLESERVARAEAERANRMKEEFLATVSHELRTPLSAILGWAQVLRETGPATPETTEGLDAIERNAEAQAQIVEDLLDMSRIVSGKIRINVQALDLVVVIKAGMDTVRSAAEAKGVRLVAEFAAERVPIVGDPNRLQQVVWNLLSNAVKFTPSGGEVRVGLRCAADRIEVSVTDTGAGIEPEFVPYVFERFRQSDSSITRKHGGLGIGLAIVKQLVELHGGSVRAASEGVGKGATFTISIPPAAPAAAVPEPAVERPRVRVRSEERTLTEVRLTDLRILFVDDAADTREVVKRFLQERGARVAVAGTVAEAMAWLERERFDVLLSDIGMPGEDGYSLIRRVRALPAEQGGRVPAMALTAYARSEDQERALRLGFQAHLAKPIDLSQLAAAVAKLVGR